MIESMAAFIPLEPFRDFTGSLPPALQLIAIVGLGAIPFIESYLGSVIGVIAGLSPFVVIPLAIIGNIASMLVAVYAAQGARRKLKGERAEPQTARRKKLRERFDKYGVAGISLLGPFVLASQITAVATVSFGASVRSVVMWQSISIVLWGVAYGLLALLGVDLLAS